VGLAYSLQMQTPIIYLFKCEGASVGRFVCLDTAATAKAGSYEQDERGCRDGLKTRPPSGWSFSRKHQLFRSLGPKDL
jgi:hypothetical protein